MKRTLKYDFPWNSIYFIEEFEIIKINRILFWICLLVFVILKKESYKIINEFLYVKKPVICVENMIITVTLDKSIVYEEISKQSDPVYYLNIFYKGYENFQLIKTRRSSLYSNL